VFDWLSEAVSHSALAYPVVFAASGTDVLFPLIPSETIVITASVLAAQGDLLIWAIVPLVAVGALIGVGRFIPGGRTATTFAAGTLEMPYRRFLFADVCAATLWAVYVSMLGYLGGETFKDSLWLPLASSLAVAALVGLGFEAWRRLQRRHGKDVLGDELPEEVA